MMPPKVPLSRASHGSASPAQYKGSPCLYPKEDLKTQKVQGEVA